MSVKFDRNYVVSTMLTNSGITRQDIGLFFNKVNDGFSNDKSICNSSLFFGCALGKYGPIIELESTNPRVASFNAIRIQALAQNLEGYKENPVSGSAIVGRKLLLSRHPKRETDQDILRAYVFFNPTKTNIRQKLDVIYRYCLKNSIEARWNSSAFSFPSYQRNLLL